MVDGDEETNPPDDMAPAVAAAEEEYDEDMTVAELESGGVGNNQPIPTHAAVAATAAAVDIDSDGGKSQLASNGIVIALYRLTSDRYVMHDTDFLWAIYFFIGCSNTDLLITL